MALGGPTPRSRCRENRLNRDDVGEAVCINEDRAVAVSDLDAAKPAGNDPHVASRYHAAGSTLEWIEHQHPGVRAAGRNVRQF